MILIHTKILPVLILFVFIFSGCIRVNVKQVNERGHVTSDMNYYPVSNEKDFRRWDGITPLHLAVVKHECSQVKKLLSKGANPFAKTVSPTKGTKFEPIEFAYFSKDKECAYVLADYTLKHYKSYLLSHRKELINTLASLWGPAPLESLELTEKYGYIHWANHIMKKLLNTRKYQGKNGRINLSRSLALRGYKNAMKAYYKVCPSCIREAFDVEIEDIEHNWSLSNDVAKHIGALKYYKPYVSAGKYKKALELQERYNADMAKASQKFRKMIAGAFKSNGNDTGGIQIKYQGRNSNDHYVYNLYYNGSYDGQIFYYPNNGGYTIMTVGIRHGQSVNGNFADGRLYTPQCGHTHADNIDDAIKKAVNCSYKSRY